jgi:hypothetical protein
MRRRVRQIIAGDTVKINVEKVFAPSDGRLWNTTETTGYGRFRE